MIAKVVGLQSAVDGGILHGTGARRFDASWRDAGISMLLSGKRPPSLHGCVS
jgi:hypothetical protein